MADRAGRVLPADTDKPHRCPACWKIPDAFRDPPWHFRLACRGWRIRWEQNPCTGHFWATYTCPDGHRFARWRRLIPRSGHRSPLPRRGEPDG